VILSRREFFGVIYHLWFQGIKNQVILMSKVEFIYLFIFS